VKITFEIPEWVNEETIWIFADFELVGFIKNGKVFVKVSRCSKCGFCCKNLEKQDFGYDENTGNCRFLRDDNLCGLGDDRPFACCTYIEAAECCTEKFERRKDLEGV